MRSSSYSSVLVRAFSSLGNPRFAESSLPPASYIAASAATIDDIRCTLRSLWALRCEGPRCLHTSSHLNLAAEAEGPAVATAGTSVHEGFLEVPGGRLPYTSQLHFSGGSDNPPPAIPCYRTIDSTGQDVRDAHVPYPLSQVRWGDASVDQPYRLSFNASGCL